MRLVQFIAMVWCVVFVSAGYGGERANPLGHTIAPWQLQDFRGATHRSAEGGESKATVIAFLGTECPLAKLYAVRLTELERKFAPQKVTFVAINSNQQDTLAEMAQFAKASGLTFPFLKDPAHEIADLFGAERTPEVFVLDAERTVRYYGRIDDQYGIGFSRPHATRRELEQALTALLEKRPVPTGHVAASGCHISRISRQTPHGTVTYARHVAPMLQQHCQECHRPGEAAPFVLSSYADAVHWSSTIREVVAEGRMPPWHADAPPGHFKNDRRLSAAERQLLFDWIDHGMPEGKSADLPPPRQFTAGWQISQPDLVLEMPRAYSVPATGEVRYQYFPVGHTFAEDTWVTASQAIPGNRATVHHIILLYVPPGARYSPGEAALRNMIATYAPGLPAWHAQPGTARKIPAKSKLYFQVHYTPNGVAALDLSKAGLVLAKPEQVEQPLLSNAIVNTRLRIPPRADNVTQEGTFRLKQDMTILSLFPHMHLRGKSFRIEALGPTGEKQLLLNVPRYDFNWQNGYVFAQPVPLPRGSTLRCIATYDNSAGNPANPDPNQLVGWGDQTWEEMLVGQFEAVLTPPGKK